VTTADLAWRAFLLLVGPFAGDYAATFAAAWPRRPRPVVGQSRCSRCGAPIGAADKIPLVSWMLKRGRRTCCGGRIPIVYPIGEAAGLASGLAAALSADPIAAAWTFALGLTLTYIALVDLRRFSLPAWGLAALSLETAMTIAAEPTLSARLARLAAGGALALAFEVLRRFVRRDGRSGLGGGDVLLAGLLGALVGWRLAAPMVSIAALAPLAIQYTTRKSGPTPFGLWLSVSTAFILLLVETRLVSE
jgi:leader peptidase (prepilin peptidase)/N-methyltransferase